MNFQDLLAKIKKIDEGDMDQGQGMMTAPSSPEVPMDVEECGDAPAQPMNQADGDFLTGECSGDMGPEQHNQQQNNVSMNVTMNGSGSGGIADLMKILRNIEHAGQDKDVIVGMDEVVDDGGFGDATTEPEEETAGIDMITRTGNDLASKGAERIKVNGGGNPMQEAIAQKLAQRYQEIKESK
jgi:hypothetical protein